MATFSSMAERIAQNYEEYRDNASRREACAQIASKYKIDPPEAILCVTDGKLKMMSVASRCRALGISEEEFTNVLISEGYQQFMADFERSGYTLLRLASQDKLNRAINTDRLDEDGNEEFGIELALVKSMPVEPTPTVTNNNILLAGGDLFDQARQQMLAPPTPSPSQVQTEAEYEEVSG